MHDQGIRKMITRREDLHNTWVDVTKDHGVVKLFAAIYDTDALFGCEISKPYNELVGGEPCVAISIDSRGGWAKHADKPFHSTLREVTMKDFMLSNDVKYYNKDKEIKPQDGFISNAIKDFKVSHKLKSKEELMSENSELDKAVKGVLRKTHNKIMSAMPSTKTEYIKLNKNDKGGKFWEVARDFSEIEGIAFYFLVDDSYLPIVSNQRLLAEFSNGNLYRKVEKQATWHDNAVEFLESISECEAFMSAINENKTIGLETDDYKIICRLVVESIDKK